MNRADAMLEVLRINEGGWWTRQEIFRWSDRYFMTNNAAAELRARGFNIEHAKRGREDIYRLGASDPCVGYPQSPVPPGPTTEAPTFFSVKV